MTLLRGPRCGWIGACRSGLGSTAKNRRAQCPHRNPATFDWWGDHKPHLPVAVGLASEARWGRSDLDLLTATTLPDDEAAEMGFISSRNCSHFTSNNNLDPRDFAIELWSLSPIPLAAFPSLGF